MRSLQADHLDRNYAKEPLSAAELERILAAAGSVAAVLNTRHAIAKAQGWKDHPPDGATFVEAVLAEPNLLRRPILIRDGRAVVGFDAAGIRALLV